VTNVREFELAAKPDISGDVEKKLSDGIAAFKSSFKAK
jgi:hypothetical protein